MFYSLAPKPKECFVALIIFNQIQLTFPHSFLKEVRRSPLSLGLYKIYINNTTMESTMFRIETPCHYFVRLEVDYIIHQDFSIYRVL